MKKILLYIILLVALTMAGIVAYVSINGLLKIFAGAGTLGLLLFSSIEVSKIVATSAIHTYGKRIGIVYNFLLALGIVIAMAITSMGIYGFLSSSYKESFSKMETTGTKIELLEKKRDGHQQQLNFVISEKETLNQTIGELSKGLSNNVIQYTDRETGQIITTTSSSTRRVLEKQLDNAVLRQENVNKKADEISDKIFSIENEMLEIKLDDESTNELSTLIYLSDITGKSMDEVMKWFILLLIIIGDPMAILMVIVFNKVVNYRDKELTKKKTSKWWQFWKKKVLNDKDEYFKSRNKLLSEKVDKLDVEREEKERERELDILKAKLKEEQKRIEDESKEDVIEETTREPIIPRGKILREDLIKDKDRGFSVDVPDPDPTKITRIGANKEIRDDKTDIVYFKRRRGDELRNE